MFKQKARSRGVNPTQLPAPLRGLNAISPIMGLREDEALVLDNLFPATDGLVLRDGYVSYSTGFADPVDRLWTYSKPLGGEELFATTAAGVFDVSAEGPIGSAEIALTEGETSCSSISTGAGSYMFLANGVDTVKIYDGTSWTSVATFGALSTVNLSYVETYRQRVYFVKRNSLELEYLSANSISGSTTNYPLGAIFRKGGYIVALCTWTVDGGTGSEDHLVVMTSQGEIAVFAGSLPSDTSLWQEKGVYQLAKPLGKQPLYKWGGDVLILTENGIYPLSSAIQSAAIERTTAISERIKPLFNTAASVYSAELGWQIIADPLLPGIIVNIPSSPVRTQFVMNAQTKAWCTYSGWAARCFARKGQEIYFGTTTAVKRVNGVADEGTNITGILTQAPTRMGTATTKKIELLKPYISNDGGFSFYLGIGANLQDPREYNMVPGTKNLTAAIWGVSRYGEAEWSGITGIDQNWRKVPDVYSVWKSFGLKIVSRNANIRYFGADLRVGTGTGL